MNYALSHSTAAIKAACAMLFFLFTVIYLHLHQPQLLEMAQYAWSGHTTHYDSTTGTIIITGALCLLTAILAPFTHFPLRYAAFVHLPAFTLLGLLTAVSVEGREVSVSLPWTLVTILILILWSLFAFVLSSQMLRKVSLLRGKPYVIFLWRRNLTTLLLMMTLTLLMGNNSRPLHTRLAIEEACIQGQWHEALTIGPKQGDRDSSITMLHALALARTGQLPERLFHYEMTGGSRALFPQPDHSTTFLLDVTAQPLWRTIGIVPRDLSEPVTTILSRELRRGTVRPVARDYLLCALLLDRDLDAFVRLLPRYYTPSADLPQHYKEALILHHALHPHLPTLFRDAAMETDYRDFRTLFRTTPAAQRPAILRDAYFGTYWQYYFR